MHFCFTLPSGFLVFKQKHPNARFLFLQNSKIRRVIPFGEFSISKFDNEKLEALNLMT